MNGVLKTDSKTAKAVTVNERWRIGAWGGEGVYEIDKVLHLSASARRSNSEARTNGA